MSALKDQLRADLTRAIKARDEVTSSTLRMVLTALTNAEVAGKQSRELSDEDAGRAESAAKERSEAEVIARYLPAPLGEAEIAELVSRTIADVGAGDEGMRAMGKVMGALQPQVRGRADGAAVAAEVRRQLG
jgi:uncharacterized protein YqeY